MSQTQTVDPIRLENLIRRAKSIAKQYRKLTGRPLGITGEVAEYEAARLLGLKLAAVRQDGYDALRTNGQNICRLQVKARCVHDTSKRGQRMGSIKLDKPWDAVLLVILDSDLEPVSIYEAGRAEITQALIAPGSKSRNERGALGVAKFKSIGKLVWKKTA